MRKLTALSLALLLALAGCAEEPAAPPPVASGYALGEEQGSLAPSEATIAMRWQLLDPQVNAFTFRNTQDVFAFRLVEAPAEARDLPAGDPLAMPAGYSDWAERTFTNAFMVLRDGKVVFEDYRNRMTAQTPHIAFSMTKTITAMLIGQAIDRGEIESLDDMASKYVPALADGAYGSASLRDIMQMRSGADIEERYDFGENPSLAAQIHEAAIVRNERRFADFAVGIASRAEPGEEFNYATLDTAVLGWVLEEATGQKIEDLMQERIWQPLGAEHDAHFLADGPLGEGRALNGMGFNATLRDFARLGQLLLDDGMAGHVRVLPQGWVEQMTQMRPTGLPDGQGFPGYGLQVWQVDGEPGAFAAVGLAGQMIYVHPQTRTVIIKLSYFPPGPDDAIIADELELFHQLVHSPDT